MMHLVLAQQYIVRTQPCEIFPIRYYCCTHIYIDTRYIATTAVANLLQSCFEKNGFKMAEEAVLLLL